MPVGINAGTFAVTESGPSGYNASFSGCSGSIAVGEIKTCTITNNDIPIGIITSSELCKFDVDSVTAGEQFLLKFQKNQGSNFTLNASNPGQLYYNVINGDTSGNVKLKIPFPFVTSGASPIHVYTKDNFKWVEDSNGVGCFQSLGTSTSYNDQITIKPGYDNFGQYAEVTVLNVPAGAYVNIHLDYGLKDTSPWKQNPGNVATKGSLTIGVPSLGLQGYDFSLYFNNTLISTQSTSSENQFN